VRPLPATDPGTPPGNSAGAYLRWLVRCHAGPLAGAAVFSSGRFGCQALLPAVLGRGVDALVSGAPAELLRWTAALLAIGLVQAGCGTAGHRFAAVSWLGPAYRTAQVVTRQVTRLGGSLPARLPAGEVVTVGSFDVDQLGAGVEALGRGAGAAAAAGTVVLIMLHTSVPLGLVVAAGVPLMMGGLAPLLRRLHHRQAAHRRLVAALTGRAGDLVAGLRVLRGVGGETAFARRYRAESQRVRAAGVAAARVQSGLVAVQTLLPGLFVVTVVWLGARSALAGAITPGELVAFYGYAVFLRMPLRQLTDVAHRLTEAHVAAGRVIAVLRLRPELSEPAHPLPGPAAGGELVDAGSGLRVAPGVATGLVAVGPEPAAAVVSRLGRLTDGDVSWGGVGLRGLATAELRRRILLADGGGRLFAGRLRDELDVAAERRGPAPDALVAAALHAAAAADVVAGLDAGLDTVISDAGREFSGGQRQRLLLARALLADPEVLILVEPTSAVDAATEAVIAQRLAAARANRTTIVVTTSPVLLDRMDTVACLAGGAVVATGQHRELLRREPRYAATVRRPVDHR
jgi:ABC-type multidrug transport system fused ATPase/permease subunit